MGHLHDIVLVYCRTIACHMRINSHSMLLCRGDLVYCCWYYTACTGTYDTRTHCCTLVVCSNSTTISTYVVSSAVSCESQDSLANLWYAKCRRWLPSSLLVVSTSAGRWPLTLPSFLLYQALFASLAGWYIVNQKSA